MNAYHESEANNRPQTVPKPSTYLMMAQMQLKWQMANSKGNTYIHIYNTSVYVCCIVQLMAIGRPTRATLSFYLGSTQYWIRKPVENEISCGAVGIG